MKRGVSALVLVLVWMSGLAAQTVTVATVEDHDKAMKTIRATAVTVPPLVTAGSFGEVKNRYVSMRAQFVGVEGFWASRKNADAAMLARNAVAKVDAIIKSAEASDKPGIDAGIKELVAACAVCHDKYREPDPAAPQSFVIRKGVLDGAGSASAPALSPAVVPVPAVAAAPAAGAAWNTSPVDLRKLGYNEREFFFSGTTAQGPYTSRMIVRRPIDARRFNGTVIVEWMNASAGFDMDVDFLTVLPLMTKEGYAYVGVSSQQVTVDFLRKRDAARYGTLKMADAMPAQPAASEVFSQAGMALRKNGAGEDPLGGLRAVRLIAIGQSQSSGRLTTFINSVHGVSLQPVYDAFLPHSGGGAPTRFPAPIIKLNSENEAPGYFSQRAVSNPSYRYWEVAGSAHQPVDGADNVLALLKAGRGGAFTCPYPVQGPGGPAKVDFVVRAAIVHLDNWLKTGKVPPTAPLMEMAPPARDAKVGVLQRDKFGNTLGGIRLPQQEAPTGRNSPAYACSSQTFPQWDVFDGNADAGKDPTDTYTEPANLKALYKDHNDYVAKFAAAARAAERAGFLLKEDADLLIKEAKNSDIAK